MHSAYAPNIISRIDRRNHLQNVFKKQSEFRLHIISPIAQNNSGLSLWLTIQHIIKENVNWNDDFFIFCEDDHQFTQHYDFELLQQFIEEGKMLDADILSGGVSWFKTGVQISENLFWVEKFSRLQFTVIFKKFYQKIVTAQFQEFDQACKRIFNVAFAQFQPSF